MSKLESIKPFDVSDLLKSDPTFPTLLKTISTSPSLLDRLATFSKTISPAFQELVPEMLRLPGPAIEKFDALGNETDRILLSPPTRALRRAVVEAGIFENESLLELYSKTYLLAHWGEVSVLCPLACTAGLAKVIEVVGSPFLKDKFLSWVLSKETPLAASQFVTEKDMGSDVGALKTKAEPNSDGTFRIVGEKWFCSAIDEYFLVAARFGDTPGTKGVGIFLVPRTLDGKVNSLTIKRLKEKIGTKELPTAEIDFEGSIAYAIGEPDQGFSNLMKHVIGTSRLFNSAGSLGLMARALGEARAYVNQREAFGKTLSSFPMVSERIFEMECHLKLPRALFFSLISRLETENSPYTRLLTHLCKYRSSLRSTRCLHEAILLFGGNGTIETFSPLPRLYRDALILETWEGTHHILSLQIAREVSALGIEKTLQHDVPIWREKIRAKGLGVVVDWSKRFEEKILFLALAVKTPQGLEKHACHFVDPFARYLEILSFTALEADSSHPWIEQECHKAWYELLEREERIRQ